MASAQIQVGMTLTKNTFLAGEAVVADISIVNRAGRDIILNGPGETSWLVFRVTDPKNRPVTSTGKPAYMAKPTIIRAGDTLKKKVLLTRHLSLEDFGSYGVTANVFFSDRRQFFSSERVRITVTDGRPFWQKVVGVPPGEPGAGEYRKLELLTFQDVDRTELYVRVRDEGGHLNYGTFSLETIILHRDPQVTIDDVNNLNVLYLTAPNMYRHVVIGTSGQIKNQKIYESRGTNRPRMLIAQDGRVSIRGGMAYTSAPTNATEDAKASTGTRSISDRSIP